MSTVSILMYHYVRDLKKSRFPRIKGLDTNLFEEQIKYILKYYRVITMQDLLDAIENRKETPRNSLLLTFDDGYKDHFDFVFPILKNFGIQGSFFFPGKAITQHSVLDVNKIHFILASTQETGPIAADIYVLLDKFREEYRLESNESYFRKLALKNRFDDAETIFIKRLLQKHLPEKLRRIIIDFLFEKYVGENEASFSKELYMDEEQLKQLRREGMFVGSHGWSHYWLDSLNEFQRKREIDLSLKFLKRLGCDISRWVMCYPYGAYDDKLVSLLNTHKCTVALTTKVGIADLNKDHPLALPRLDTNDLPKDANAGPNEWTLKVKRPLKPMELILL